MLPDLSTDAYLFCPRREDESPSVQAVNHLVVLSSTQMAADEANCTLSLDEPNYLCFKHASLAALFPVTKFIVSSVQEAHNKATFYRPLHNRVLLLAGSSRYLFGDISVDLVHGDYTVAIRVRSSS